MEVLQRSSGWIAAGVAAILLWQCGCGSKTETTSSSTSQPQSALSQSESVPAVSPDDKAAPSTPGSGGDFVIDPAAATASPEPQQDLRTGKGGVSLRVVDLEGYRELISRHQGKVVLVDCWATWCGPCKKQFPHTVELARNHAEHGLVAVSLSFDDGDARREALKFLEANGATFENLISKLGGNVEAFAAFEIEGGALPFYKLYDRTGKLRYQFSGITEGAQNVLPISEIDQRVQELLNEGA